MGCVRDITKADARYGSHIFQHTFQLFVTQIYALLKKFLFSLYSPDSHCIRQIDLSSAACPLVQGQSYMRGRWWGGPECFDHIR